jgi:hypothetical protein
VKLTSAEAIAPNGFFGTPPEEFPFTFLPAYARFVGLSGEKVVFLQHSGLRATAPIRLFPRRVLKCAQWLCPPMREGQVLQSEEEKQFIELGNAVAQRTLSCDRFIQPPNQALFQVAPFRSRSCRFGTYLLPLAGRTEAEVFASFHSTHRRHIRKAIRDGAIVRFGPDVLDAFFRVYQETMARSNQSGSTLDELRCLQEILGPGNMVCVVAFDKKETPLGGVFGPRTRESFYYLFGASTQRPTIPGAVKLAHWELIRDCLNRGVRQYNFVGARLSDVSGTKLEHIQEFKARFGSTLRKGYLWKMDLRPAITSVYEAANGVRKAYRWVRTGSTASYADIIDQEQGRILS